MKYFITQSADNTWSIYTDTGMYSMADEKLVNYGILTKEIAIKIVTDQLDGTYSLDV